MPDLSGVVRVLEWCRKNPIHALVFLLVAIGLVFVGSTFLVFGESGASPWIPHLADVSSWRWLPHAVGPVLIATLLILPFVGRQKRKVLWARATLRLKIPGDDLQRLSSRLAEIRSVAQARYARIKPGTDAGAVRANIFLPDTRNASVGEVCGLFIPSSLHHGMTDPTECQLEFRPNEGLTGRVYSSQRALGAARKTENNPWKGVELEIGSPTDEKFTLTLQHEDQISSHLRWIVSIPLKVSVDGNKKQTVGVLNVDGLDAALSDSEMKDIFGVVQSKVHEIEEIMDQLELDEVSIEVRELARKRPSAAS